MYTKFPESEGCLSLSEKSRTTVFELSSKSMRTILNTCSTVCVTPPTMLSCSMPPFSSEACHVISILSFKLFITDTSFTGAGYLFGGLSMVSVCPECEISSLFTDIETLKSTEVLDAIVSVTSLESLVVNAY